MGKGSEIEKAWQENKQTKKTNKRDIVYTSNID